MTTAVGGDNGCLTIIWIAACKKYRRSNCGKRSLIRAHSVIAAIVTHNSERSASIAVLKSKPEFVPVNARAPTTVEANPINWLIV